MLTAAPAAHATPLYAQAILTKTPVPFDSSPRPALASEHSTPVETAANGGTNAAIGDPSTASFSQGEASNTPSQSNNGNGGDNPQQLPDPSQGLVNFSPDKAEVPSTPIASSARLRIATPDSINKAGQTIAPISNSGVFTDSHTYVPGETDEISGMTLSVGSSDVFVNGARHTLTIPSGNLVLFDGQPIVRASNGGYLVVGSQTIARGATAIISGYVISDETSGNFILDGKFYNLATTAGAVLSAASLSNSILTIAGQTFTAVPSGFAVDSHLLSPGGYHYIIRGEALVSLDLAGWLHVGSTSSFVSSASSPAAKTGLAGLIMNGFGVQNGKTDPGVGGSIHKESGAVVAYTGPGTRLGLGSDM